MKLAYSADHEALRRELRAYYAKLLTPEILAECQRSEGVGPVVVLRTSGVIACTAVGCWAFGRRVRRDG